MPDSDRPIHLQEVLQSPSSADWLPSLFYREDIAAIGSLASIVGIIFTVWTLLVADRARQAAEQAKQATVESFRLRDLQADVIPQLEEVGEEITALLFDQREGQGDQAVASKMRKRYAALDAMLSTVSLGLGRNDRGELKQAIVAARMIIDNLLNARAEPTSRQILEIQSLIQSVLEDLTSNRP